MILIIFIISKLDNHFEMQSTLTELNGTKHCCCGWEINYTSVIDESKVIISVVLRIFYATTFLTGVYWKFSKFPHNTARYFGSNLNLTRIRFNWIPPSNTFCCVYGNVFSSMGLVSCGNMGCFCLL